MYEGPSMAEITFHLELRDGRNKETVLELEIKR